MKKLKAAPQPPKGLGNEAKALWRKINAEFELDDAALAILGVGLESFDRMKEAQTLLTRDGLVILDRFGQQKQHPAASIERDSRAAFVRSLKDLNLDIEPLNPGPGRPTK